MLRVHISKVELTLEKMHFYDKPDHFVGSSLSSTKVDSIRNIAILHMPVNKYSSLHIYTICDARKLRLPIIHYSCVTLCTFWFEQRLVARMDLAYRTLHLHGGRCVDRIQTPAREVVVQ